MSSGKMQLTHAEWAEKREAVEALVLEIDEGLRTMVSDIRPLLVRGACLARSTRLLQAMLVLHDAELVDVTTVPMRPLLEQWLVALWVEFRPVEALDLLEKERDKSLEKINRLAELGFYPALYGPGDDLPTWETLSQWVGNHLQAKGQTDARRNVDLTYNLVYRAESHRSVHAGLGTVIEHLREVDEDRMGLRVIRSESSDGRGEILWAATVVAMLAYRVFTDFGLSTDRLDEISPCLPPRVEALPEE